MPIGKLKALNVARMKTPGMYGDGGGLWLQVTSAGAKSWILRYWVAERDPATGGLISDPKTKRARGKSREMGLGSCATVSLEGARTLAQEYRRLLRTQGVDPIDARRDAQGSARSRMRKRCPSRMPRRPTSNLTARDGGTRNTPRNGR
jgi:hypothetical protein